MVSKVENPTWVCPHCNNVTGPDSLARDLLVEHLLETLPKRATEIEYTGDHTNYKIAKTEDPDSDDDDDDDERNSIDTSKLAEKNATREQDLTTNKTQNDVIDLISDDEEEEEGETGNDSNQASSTANGNVPLKRSWEAQNH